MEKGEQTKKAKEKLDQLNKDEKEQNMALLREKSLHDEATLREEGYEDGYAEGTVNGIAKGKKEDAKRMLDENIDVETISRVTDIPIEEIEKLK